MKNTIIFDVDGTLIDGTEGILNSVKYAIEKMGLRTLNQEELISFVGPPIQNSAKEKFNLSDKDAQTFANIFRQKYAEGDVFLAKVYNGIYELLNYLKNNNCKMGVATYKREDYANSLMKYYEFDKFFDSICGADNENKLTKFNILENCKNSLSEENTNFIMIGDSYHDAEAAQKLGMCFIGVTYGFGFKSINDVNQYPNIFCANKPLEILNFFKLS